LTLNEYGVSRQSFVIVHSNKFHENPSGGPDRHTDDRHDEAKRRFSRLLRPRLKLLTYSVDIFRGLIVPKLYWNYIFRTQDPARFVILKFGLCFRYIYSVAGPKCKVIPTKSSPSPQTCLRIYYSGIKSE